MSFIAITYGYNQFSIFNTNTSTLPLIDNIVTVCLDDIQSLFQFRLASLNKEIEIYSADEESYKRTMRKLEGDKQREEEKIAEAVKAMELAGKETNNKKGGARSTLKPNIKKKDEIDLNSPVNVLVEELKLTDQKLLIVSMNKEKTIAKKKLLLENMEKYKSIDRTVLKIELVDGNGEKVNINTKGDLYANQYLIDRQCYELHKLLTSK